MKKTPERQLTSPWPFPVSVLPNGKEVRNVPPPRPPLPPLKPVPPSDLWESVALL